jgi:hypothetical protein
VSKRNTRNPIATTHLAMAPSLHTIPRRSEGTSGSASSSSTSWCKESSQYPVNQAQGRRFSSMAAMLRRRFGAPSSSSGRTEHTSGFPVFRRVSVALCLVPVRPDSSDRRLTCSPLHHDSVDKGRLLLTFYFSRCASLVCTRSKLQPSGPTLQIQPSAAQVRISPAPLPFIFGGLVLFMLQPIDSRSTSKSSAHPHYHDPSNSPAGPFLDLVRPKFKSPRWLI